MASVSGSQVHRALPAPGGPAAELPPGAASAHGGPPAEARQDEGPGRDAHRRNHLTVFRGGVMFCTNTFTLARNDA